LGGYLPENNPQALPFNLQVIRYLDTPRGGEEGGAFVSPDVDERTGWRSPPSTLHPTPCTQNPKPKPQNPKPKTQHPTPKHKTQNAKHKTQNRSLEPPIRKPQTSNLKPSTLYTKLSIRLQGQGLLGGEIKPEIENPKSETRNQKPETRNPKPEIPNQVGVSCFEGASSGEGGAGWGAGGSRAPKPCQP